MGIFDRGGKTKPHAPTASDAEAAEAGAGDFADSPVQEVALRSAPPRAAPVAAVEERPHFGIAEAIKLMRDLPVDQNVELVVRVIKTTLESLKVRVPDIIADAIKKQEGLATRMSTLRSEIVELEREIQQRKEEIARHEADQSETASVKARLELAEKSAKSG